MMNVYGSNRLQNSTDTEKENVFSSEFNKFERTARRYIIFFK